MQFTELMKGGEYEQVVFVVDPVTELRFVIAIHSTALGPSLGGIRFWHYDTDAAMIADALVLSEAMSLKAAAAGLHQGGGKAVVRWPDPAQARSPDQLWALGRAIDALGGRYRVRRVRTVRAGGRHQRRDDRRVALRGRLRRREQPTRVG